MAGLRLDSFLAEHAGVSRNRVQGLIKEKKVFLDGHSPKKAGVKLQLGQELKWDVPQAEETDLIAQDIPLQILHEDDELLAINKEPGIVVHPDESGHSSGTIVNAVLAHCGDSLTGIGGERRPGIVHRLDMDTSGALVIAKTADMHQKLSSAFHDREVHKLYWALVRGCPKTDKGRIEAPIRRDTKDRKKMAVNAQGKRAVSEFEVLERFEGVSLLAIRIETGRTHQIRVHMASIGHPVVGDSVYGDAELNHEFRIEHSLDRQFLHARELEILDYKLKAPLSEDLENVLNELRA